MKHILGQFLYPGEDSWVYLVQQSLLTLPCDCQAMASSLYPEHFNLSFHFFQRLIKDWLKAESKCGTDKDSQLCTRTHTQARAHTNHVGNKNNLQAIIKVMQRTGQFIRFHTSTFRKCTQNENLIRTLSSFSISRVTSPYPVTHRVLCPRHK